MFSKKRIYALVCLVAAMGILGAVFLTGCEKPEQQVDKDQVTKKVLETLYPEETRPNLEKFAYGGKNFFGKTTDEMIMNFGEPLEVRETPIKNTHAPEQIDTFLEVKFKGLDVRAYKINRDVDPDRELIFSVELTSVWNDPDTGLGIGTDRADVRRILGDPDKIENTLDHYTVNTDGYPPDVYFTYENDKVAGIKWQYHFD